MTPDPSRYYIRKPGSSATFIPCPHGTPGLNGPAEVKINALGLRGREPNGQEVQILVFGGSTVEDNLLNDADMWTAQLEKRLGHGAWVGNAGRAGCNSRQHVAQVEKLLPQFPGVSVAVVLCGLNDMLADSGAHHDSPSDYVPFGCGPGVQEADAPNGQTFALGARIGLYKGRRLKVRDADWRCAIDLTAACAAYADRLSMILADCRHHRVTPVLVTQPMLWKEHMTEGERRHCYAGGFGAPGRWEDKRCPWYMLDALRAMLEAYNATMRAVCAERQVQCIDLAATLPRQITNFYDDFHFTQAGARSVAIFVANALKARGIAAREAA